MNEASPAADYRARVEVLYSREFLAELGVAFRFDALAPDMAQEIREIGFRYFAERGSDARSPELQRARRKDYQALKSRIAQFREFLRRPEYEDLATDVHFAALKFERSAPEMNFGELPGNRKFTGASRLADVFRLLDMLDRAADEGAARLAPAKGRRRNFALEGLVRRAAFIWTEILGRAFTLDYHKGAALTEAFTFVKALIAPLDPELPEKALITAMRNVIAEKSALARRAGEFPG